MCLARHPEKTPSVPAHAVSMTAASHGRHTRAPRSPLSHAICSRRLSQPLLWSLLPFAASHTAYPCRPPHWCLHATLLVIALAFSTFACKVRSTSQARCDFPS